MNEEEMIEEAMQRALMTPILHNREADVDYYLDEVRREQQKANAIEQWESMLPDEWDTHKLGGITSSRIAVCADDCEACKFRFALKTMPLTVWVGVDEVGTPVFTTRSKRLAEQLCITEWEGEIITITEMDVTQ
jgi:hypothetical protein